MSRRNNQGTTVRRHRTKDTVQPVTEIQDIIIRVELQLKINQSGKNNVKCEAPTTTNKTHVTHPNNHSTEHSHVRNRAPRANAHWDTRREFERPHPSWGPRGRPITNGNRRAGIRGRINRGQRGHTLNIGSAHSGNRENTTTRHENSAENSRSRREHARRT